jgi:aspartyl aminopeptidase
MRIPNLAIHLNRDVNEKGFCPNLQTHMVPILATQVKCALGTPSDAAESDATHHPVLVEVLAEQLKCSPKDVIDFELNVCDVQPRCVTCSPIHQQPK